MPEFQTWIVQLTAMVSDVLVSIAAVFGVFGLWQWRREMIGRTRYELARKIVSLSFQYQDQMIHARYPFTTSDELVGREHSEQERVEETQILDERFARWKRLEPVRKILRELQLTVWESELLFRKEELEPVHTLIRAFNEYSLTLDEFFDIKLFRATHPDEPLDNISQIRQLIYGRPGDTFSIKLNEEISSLKKMLSKYVQ